MVTAAEPTPADPSSDRLLRPGQVAVLFGVSPKTVSRWGEAGLLPAQRTSGGHRRFRASDVRALLTARGTVGAPEEATTSVDA